MGRGETRVVGGGWCIAKDISGARRRRKRASESKYTGLLLYLGSARWGEGRGWLWGGGWCIAKDTRAPSFYYQNIKAHLGALHLLTRRGSSNEKKDVIFQVLQKSRPHGRDRHAFRHYGPHHQQRGDMRSMRPENEIAVLSPVVSRYCFHPAARTALHLGPQVNSGERLNIYNRG